jgi:hypothetical protein
MNSSLVDEHDKILIQIAGGDEKGLILRFMVGEVIRANDFGMRISGYNFYCDLEMGTFVRRKTPLTLLVSFNDQRLIQVVMPRNINIDDLSFSNETEPTLEMGNNYRILLKDLIPLPKRIKLK